MPRACWTLTFMVSGCDTQGRAAGFADPRMHERAFVLIPLCEIAPELSLGALGRVRELALKIEDAGVERLPE